MKRSSYSFVFLIIIILLAAAIWISFSTKRNNNYTYEDYKKSVKAGEVVSVTIEQNKEVPTGTVYVITSDPNDQKNQKFERREVAVGLSDGLYVELKSGVKDGELLRGIEK